MSKTLKLNNLNIIPNIFQQSGIYMSKSIAFFTQILSGRGIMNSYLCASERPEDIFAMWCAVCVLIFCSAVRIIAWGGMRSSIRLQTHRRHPQFLYTHIQQMLQRYVRQSAGEASLHITHTFTYGL